MLTSPPKLSWQAFRWCNYCSKLCLTQPTHQRDWQLLFASVPSYSLTNGHYGHVMATLKKEKAVVCSSYYLSDANARVMCRSLGFNSGEIYTGPHAAPETSTAWFTDSMYCNGDEASLDICIDGNWTKRDISGKQNSSNVYYTSSCLSNIFSVFCYGEGK